MCRTNLEDAMMKASCWALSAAVAVCVTHAAGLAQPPRWPGANPSCSPFDPSSLGGVRNPFDPPSSGEWRSRLGPYRPVPPELRTSDFIGQGPRGNPSPGATRISPELLAQLANPPKFDPQFDRVRLPVHPPAWHEPSAAPVERPSGWAVVSFFVLGLLALVLLTHARRKPTDR
jgi:hypothetical protein